MEIGKSYKVKTSFNKSTVSHLKFLGVTNAAEIKFTVFDFYDLINNEPISIKTSEILCYAPLKEKPDNDDKELKTTLAKLKSMPDVKVISLEDIFGEIAEEDEPTVAEEIEIDDDEPEEITGVVVGKIITIRPHINASLLNVLKVQVESDVTVQIVCGFDDLKVGDYVAVARIGAHVPTFKDPVAPVMIRGELSQGFITSAFELGLSDLADPYVFKNEYTVGNDAIAYILDELEEDKEPEAVKITLTVNDDKLQSEDKEDWMGYLANELGIELSSDEKTENDPWDDYII